jgi:hypothetical protein
VFFLVCETYTCCPPFAPDANYGSIYSVQNFLFFYPGRRKTKYKDEKNKKAFISPHSRVPKDKGQ